MTVSNRLNQLVELAGNISNAFTIALYKADLDQKWPEAQPFKIKLEKILNNTPLFVEGEPMQICAELGMSSFPDNGKTISKLIGASLHETASKFFSKTTTTL